MRGAKPRPSPTTIAVQWQRLNPPAQAAPPPTERRTVLDQFSRTRLTFGNEGVEALANARVIVFGCGGVGGYVCESLVRSGLGAIDIVDDDKVCLTNINRQVIATWKTIGLNKVDAMEERLHDINPSCKVTKHQCFFLPENASQFDFSQYDYVVDCVDTVTAKLELVMRAKAAGTPIICAMGAGNKLDPTAIRIADIYDTEICRLARIIRKELRKRGVKSLKVAFSPEPTVKLEEDGKAGCAAGCVCPPGSERTCLQRRSVPGSNAFVPAAMGLAIGSAVAQDLMRAAQ
jgi:tRNA threonylcarbamoyladenosine dehydratase